MSRHTDLFDELRAHDPAPDRTELDQLTANVTRRLGYFDPPATPRRSFQRLDKPAVSTLGPRAGWSEGRRRSGQGTPDSPRPRSRRGLRPCRAGCARLGGVALHPRPEP
jgi:hypothetical protein